jgi:hypothetical protein
MTNSLCVVFAKPGSAHLSSGANQIGGYVDCTDPAA